uniref:NADAR domain-containing protein n=1 Tax=Romanomermis culicivorax TaxID=13658 RepID=A0A915I5L5_ROMCU
MPQDQYQDFKWVKVVEVHQKLQFPDKVTYKFTKCYLFHQKAMAMGDKEAAQIILNAPNAIILNAPNALKAKKIAGKLPWDFTKLAMWHNFTFKANGYKYKQDYNLRHQFFNTVPALLVGANAYESYWGCEFKSNDPSMNDFRSYSVKLLRKLRVLSSKAAYGSSSCLA